MTDDEAVRQFAYDDRRVALMASIYEGAVKACPDGGYKAIQFAKLACAEFARMIE